MKPLEINKVLRTPEIKAIKSALKLVYPIYCLYNSVYMFKVVYYLVKHDILMYSIHWYITNDNN